MKDLLIFQVNDRNVVNPSKLQTHNELPLVSLNTSLLTFYKLGCKGMLQSEIMSNVYGGGLEAVWRR